MPDSNAPSPAPDATRARPPRPGSPAPRRRWPPVYGRAIRLRDWVVDRALLAPRFGAYGRRTHVALPVRLNGEHRIAVGSACYIGAGSWLQTIDDDGCIALTIDDDVHMAGLCVVSAARHVHVGRGALFARGVYVADHGHAFDRADVPVHAQGVSEAAPVVIGAGAWLGQNVVVLPGVEIGAGAVVGANAVVRDSIPERCLAVGAPARVIRRLDDDPPPLPETRRADP
ncbi:MAG: acyltransferase [Deltaproteobacteria bacterium]|nr:MAG: acyltransferase [Deltaproteobacteria bacterium]